MSTITQADNEKLASDKAELAAVLTRYGYIHATLEIWEYLQEKGIIDAFPDLVDKLSEMSDTGKKKMFDLALLKKEMNQVQEESKNSQSE